jgi:hypothetical protein
MLEQSLEMPFFMRHLFVLVPGFSQFPAWILLFSRTGLLPRLPARYGELPAPEMQSEWWCASRFSHGNFKHGAFLSAAMSPLSRSAMSIVLLPPRQRITLVK